jgi:predicted RecB family nuclease
MTKITRDVIESYMACHYKAFLKLTGHEGAIPDHRSSLPSKNCGFPLTSVDEVHSKHVKNQNAATIVLTSSHLRQGALLIANGLFETDLISLKIDGLQRVAGASDIGDFHYLPLVSHSATQGPQTQKLLLDVYGFVLSDLQGRIPDRGISQGPGKKSTMQLSPGLKTAERLLKALNELQMAEAPPLLTLNEHCQVCEFQSRCHAQAVEEDNLSLLQKISKSEIMRLRKKGIFTINQLSYTFRPRHVKKRAKNPAYPHYFALQARALREKTVFVHGAPGLNARDTRIYMDFEGTPIRRSYYLIGLLVVHSEVIYQRSFWADGDDGEARIFMEMLDYIRPYRDFSVLHYGAYEIRALRRMQVRLPANYALQINEVLKHTVNILSLIGPHIYFPTFSNSLKEIAGFLGHKWSSNDASGRQTLLWRDRWNETRDGLMKDELIRYNMEDCKGLKIVTDFIEQIGRQQAAEPNTNGAFCHTDNFEKEAGQRGKFQKQQFVLDQFDFINQCSYFDYQKDRMSARDIRRVKSKPPMGKRAPKIYRNNKIIQVFVSRCPACRSKKISALRPLKRQVIDLKFSGAAVRRWVALYLSKEYRCRKCNRKFIPDGFPKIWTKFGKGLLSWCMYQIIVGGQNMMRIRAGLAKMFGIYLEVPSIYNFKRSISLHYREAYDNILKNIMNSPVLYMDETTANLRSESGYVWCLTDGHTVYYFYKTSREGSFLADMFRDFGGVLVSDFYTANDSVDCRQQRCLVHLMRDFNEEMQKNPFDNELKLMATKFSVLLKDAVATIDKFGFKSRHLAKHKAAAAHFCHWASNCEFGSPPAERLRSRIAKYQDQLFTFLDRDGVSWNNTNAEHSIKPFARYRRAANGVFTARSVAEYLVILSIAETCRGRGQDFLEFLLKDNEHNFSFRPARRAAAKAASDDLAPRSPP